MTRTTRWLLLLPFTLCSALLFSCSTFHDVGGSQKPDPTPVTVTVSLDFQGSGRGAVRSLPEGLDCDAACSASFAAGSELTLTATPQAGSVFNGWLGCPSSNEATCRVKIGAAALTIGARFDVIPKNPVVISVETQGPGRLLAEDLGLDCSLRCKPTYEKGTHVVLTPRPDPYSYFAGWSGACSGTGPTCEVTLSQAASAQALFSPAHCPHPNFCWSNPLPTGTSLGAMWGTAKDDIWAGGDASGLFHWNGVGWTLEPISPPPAPALPLITAIWGNRRDNYYLSMNGALYHYDGASWTAMATPGGAYKISGSADNNIWATSSGGNVLRYDGSSWSAIPIVVGTGGVDLYTSGPNDVWVLAPRDALYHYDGAGWSAYSNPIPMQLCSSIAGGGPKDIYASCGPSVIHWDGTSWSIVAGVPGLQKIFYQSASNVWGVTADQLHHWDGTTWQLTAATGQYDGGRGLLQNLFAAGSTVWVVGRDSGVLRRLEGGSLVPFYKNLEIPAGGYDDTNLRKVWVGSATDAWTVGDKGTLAHWNGTQWMKQDAGTTERLSAIAGLAGDDLWVGGANGLLLHYDGAGWTRVPTDPSISTQTIMALWPYSDGKLWMATDRATAVLRSPMGWSMQQLAVATGPYFGCLWGTDPDNLFLTTANRVFRWNSLMYKWTQMPYAVTDITCVTGSAPNDVWLGDNWGSHWGHYDGTRFDRTVTHYVFDDPILDMATLSASDVWATGQFQNRLAHWDGSVWKEVPFSTPALYGIGHAGSEMWTVGARATILRYRP